MRMRAAVLEEFGAPLVVQEVELAEPKAGEVLVRLEACGVCHTDMYIASGADPSGYAPTVLGHASSRTRAATPATVHRLQGIRADSTAWRISCTRPVCPRASSSR